MTTTFASGQELTASGLNTAFSAEPQGILYRARRATAESGIAATENGTLRLDGITATAGRAYRITTGVLSVASTLNEAAQVTAFLRVDATGSAATTSSTVLAQGRIVTQAGTGAGSAVVEYHYFPSSTFTLSVLLTITRTAGSGTITAAGPDASIGPEIIVEDLGLAPSNTGTDV